MKHKIRTIILDDFPGAIECLKEDLSKYPDIEIVDCLTSATTAVKSIIKHQPDLLFLDIEMPDMSGLELLDQIQKDIQHMCVVFYTAHNYLIDAIRASAFDYLQKPYLPEELDLIMNRYIETNVSDSVNFRQSLSKLMSKDDRFAVQTITGLMLVKRQDVILFQYLKDQRCWIMKLTNTPQIKLRTNIVARELTSLAASFVQINQQCIVNLDYVSTIENKTLKCILYPPFSDINQVVSFRYYKKIRDDLDIL